MAGLGLFERVRGSLDQVTERFIDLKLRDPDRCRRVEIDTANVAAARRRDLMRDAFGPSDRFAEFSVDQDDGKSPLTVAREEPAPSDRGSHGTGERVVHFDGEPGAVLVRPTGFYELQHQ